MLERVISGGQTGADQAGWRAAKRCGVATGGWMPQGFRTEGKVNHVGFLTDDESHPEFADLYGAEESWSRDWSPRRIANVADADLTLIFIQGGAGPGTRATMGDCRKARKPMIVVIRDAATMETPSQIAYVIRFRKVRVLNVAGGRESGAPGIGAWVEEYLVEVFRLLGHPLVGS